jgi:hypothetical protein
MAEITEAMQYMASMRGRYIMSQVMYVAIRAMESVEEPHRETSNIRDMKYLRDEVFNDFPDIVFEQWSCDNRYANGREG